MNEKIFNQNLLAQLLNDIVSDANNGTSSSIFILRDQSLERLVFGEN